LIKQPVNGWADRFHQIVNKAASIHARIPMENGKIHVVSPTTWSCTKTGGLKVLSYPLYFLSKNSA
jgi:hypothetical protein